MATNHSYPRVTISTTALSHSNIAPEAADTTVMFVPFLSERGPNEQIRRLHSLSDFISTYGEADYDLIGQTALNIYNWLNNGGTVYAYNMQSGEKASGEKSFDKEVADHHHYIKVEGITTPEDGIEYFYLNRNAKEGDTDDASYAKLGEKTSFSEGVTYYTKGNPVTETQATIKITAKYPGSFYNGIETLFSKSSAGLYNITIRKTINSRKEILEILPRVNLADIKGGINSEYILLDAIVKDKAFIGDDFSITLKTEPATEADNYKAFIDKLCKFWETNATNILANPLDTPIDIIIDAGYPKDVKQKMMDFIKNTEDDQGLRNDIFLILDSFEYKKYLSAPTRVISNSIEETSGNDYLSVDDATNIAVYDQYFMIEDNTFTDQDIYVTPTYFLTKLIAYNDNAYGIQYPTAGLRRGILSDAIAVYNNPTPDNKETLFVNKINYAERTTREIAFMNQRTHDGSSNDNYTALSFINNERVLERMKKDIERLGRDYLFEFNDSVTLANMSSVLNKYVSGWISNRTLSSGVVTVAKNPYSDEAVDITLTIKFTGTIEVISVSITIE